MNKKAILLTGFIFFFFAQSCDTGNKGTATVVEDRIEINKIAFGSCANQNKPLPILNITDKYNPDLFIFLGDNIYGDTRDMNILKGKYNILGSKPEFIRLKKKSKILATWDDHDYGENDAGKYYPFKKESKEVFMDFWEVDKNSEMRKREGIYNSVFFGEGENSVQIILLDTRTFRDNVTLNDKQGKYKNDYQPCQTKDSTFLGAQQWNWLEKELLKPAGIRIIASSNQFAHEYNGWESWTNFPHEKEKFFSKIRKTKAEGVVFISGDVHWGELSVNKEKGLYSIYDVTSSGLSQNWHNTEPNKNRVGEVIRENNFGFIQIEREQKTREITSLTIKIIDINGHERVVKKIPINELKF